MTAASLDFYHNLFWCTSHLVQRMLSITLNVQDRVEICTSGALFLKVWSSTILRLADADNVCAFQMSPEYTGSPYYPDNKQVMHLGFANTASESESISDFQKAFNLHRWDTKWATTTYYVP